MSRRVVVTGLGMITPLGHTAEESWSAMVAGRSGTARISLFDPEAFPSQVAGEVKDFDPVQFMDRKDAKRADRTTQFTFVAADEAIRQSGLQLDREAGCRAAVIIGTAIGGITTMSADNSSHP